MLKSKPSKLYLIDLSDTVPEDEVLFELLLETTLEYDFRGEIFSVVIPKGFQTNFGSVPKRFRGLISNIGRYNKSYLLHDYQYSLECKQDISRSDADILLRKNLESDGMSWFDRWSVYYSVKYFGSSKWRKN